MKILIGGFGNMNKNKDYFINIFILLPVIITGSVLLLSGCGDNEKIVEITTEGAASVEENSIIEEGEEIDENSSYLELITGGWLVSEYVGTIQDLHFEEAGTDDYQEKEDEYVQEVVDKNIGETIRIEHEDLDFYGPITELGYVIQDDEDLFTQTRFIPREIEMSPPYIGVRIWYKDKEEDYNFIISDDGVVLLEVEYCFFRLERIDDKIVNHDLQNGVFYGGSDRYFPLFEGIGSL